MHVHEDFAHSILSTNVGVEVERMLVHLQHARSLPDPTPHLSTPPKPARNPIAAISRLASIRHVQSVIVHREVVRVVVPDEESNHVSPKPQSLTPCSLLQEGLNDARVHAGATRYLHLVSRRVEVLQLTVEYYNHLPSLHELLGRYVEERHCGDTSALLLLLRVSSSAIPLDDGWLDAPKSQLRVPHTPTIARVKEPQVHSHAMCVLTAVHWNHIVK